MGTEPPARHRGEGCSAPQPFPACRPRGVTSVSPLRHHYVARSTRFGDPDPPVVIPNARRGWERRSPITRSVKPNSPGFCPIFPALPRTWRLPPTRALVPAGRKELSPAPRGQQWGGTAPPRHVPEAQVRFCRSLKSRRGHTPGVGERCKGLIPLGTGRPPPQVLHQPIPCACETNYTRSHLISF